MIRLIELQTECRDVASDLFKEKNEHDALKEKYQKMSYQFEAQAIDHTKKEEELVEKMVKIQRLEEQNKKMKIDIKVTPIHFCLQIMFFLLFFFLGIH